MGLDHRADLQSLLDDAKAAHGVYEAVELGGVYDRQWPRWYADYLVDHGIAELLGRQLEVNELAGALEASWQAQTDDGVPAEEWATYTARWLASELGR